MNLSSIFSSVIRFFFPYECLGCGTEDALLCKKCVQKLQPDIHRLSTKAPYLQKIWVMGDYHMPIMEQSIRALKFSYAQEVVDDMYPFFRRCFANISLPKNSVLCPVPLHFFRKNTRGFNQAECIARACSRVTGLPVLPLLRRHKHTIPQTQLSGEQRRKNLKNAFSLQKNASVDRHTPIVLVDDVTTTFSTLTECARTLKKNGYTTVLALVVARSMGK